MESTAQELQATQLAQGDYPDDSKTSLPFKIRQQLYLHQGPFIDFLAYVPSESLPALEQENHIINDGGEESKAQPLDRSYLLLKQDDTLKLLDAQTFHVKRQKILGHSHGGRACLAHRNKAYVSIKNRTLTIYEVPSLKEVKTVKTQTDVIRKFHMLDSQHLMMTIGVHVWVLETHSDEVVYKGKVAQGGLTQGRHVIFDIAPFKDHEFAVAVGSLQGTLSMKKGCLRFVKLIKNGSGLFMLYEVPDEVYFDGKSVYCVENIGESSMLVACYYGDAGFHVVDRETRQVTQRIANPTDSIMFNSLQTVKLQQKDQGMYLVCKDAVGLVLIDIQKNKADLLLEVPFEGVYCGDYTIIQYPSAAQEYSFRIATVANKFGEDSEFPNRMLIELEQLIFH